MKLWRAMLKGSAKRGQSYRRYFAEGKSCALGAAWEGAGFEPEWIFSSSPFLSRYFPILKVQVKLPAGASVLLSTRRGLTMSTIIVGLNDLCGWSREAIAEWVKTIEDKTTREKWEARKEKRAIHQPEVRVTRSEQVGIAGGV